MMDVLQQRKGKHRAGLNRSILLRLTDLRRRCSDSHAQLQQLQGGCSVASPQGLDGLLPGSSGGSQTLELPFLEPQLHGSSPGGMIEVISRRIADSAASSRLYSRTAISALHAKQERGLNCFSSAQKRGSIDVFAEPGVSVSRTLSDADLGVSSTLDRGYSDRALHDECVPKIMAERTLGISADLRNFNLAGGDDTIDALAEAAAAQLHTLDDLISEVRLHA